MKTNCFAFRAVFFCVAATIISLTSKAQLDKGTWLIGGSGSFSSITNHYSGGSTNFDSDVTEINISPVVGYFLFDKFSAGLKPSYTTSEQRDIQNSWSDVKRFEIGPFARYYFLDKEKLFNILVDATYQYGKSKLTGEKGNSNTVSLMAGPVLYFNSSVALEFLFGYYKSKESYGMFNREQDGLKISLGFQFHLEKK